MLVQNCFNADVFPDPLLPTGHVNNEDGATFLVLLVNLKATLPGKTFEVIISNAA